MRKPTATTHVVLKPSTCCSDLSKVPSKRHRDQQNGARQRVPRVLANVPNFLAYFHRRWRKMDLYREGIGYGSSYSHSSS